MERTGVHGFDGEVLIVGEGTTVDGAEAALAEAVRGEEGGGSGAEVGVGEAVWGLGIGRNSAFAGELAEAEG